MKRNRLLLIIALMVLAGLFLMALLVRKGRKPQESALTKPATPAPSVVPAITPLPTAVSPDAVQVEKRQAAVRMVEAMLNAPIVFYGRAVDQFGEPIAGARVDYTAVDKFWQPGSNYTGVTDEAGGFSINGINGAYLPVGVWKDGYDGIKGQSFGSFAFGKGRDQQVDRVTPTKDDPAVFILRKKAETEPLIVVSSRQYKVPKDGAPFDIDLKTGKPAGVGTGDLRVERWANDQEKDAAGRFDWRCRLSVPGGGLIERNPELDFEAPEDGYRESVEVNMPQSLNEKWQYTKQAEYFLKLKDGSFARAALTMYAGHNNFLVLESYLNPQAGSRKLEYDKKKEVAVQGRK